MKKLLPLLCFCFSCFFAQAQIQNVCGKDTIILQADNYAEGILEWQESLDALTWVTLPEITGITYKFLPDQTKYYRALVKTSACEPLSSTITLVHIPPAANAGIDRVIGDTKMTMSGNRITGAKGEWKIISGNGGSITDNTNPCTEFSGVYNQSYKLVWSLSNLCGQTTDTVTVKFEEVIVNKNFIVVDNTDKILSDSNEMANGLYKIKFSDPGIAPTDSVLLIGIREDMSFLRKVYSFTYSDSIYSFNTIQGSLGDLIISGTLNLGDALNQSILQSGTKSSDIFPTRETIKQQANNKGLLVLYNSYSANGKRIPAVSLKGTSESKTYNLPLPNMTFTPQKESSFEVSIKDSYVSITPNFMADYTKTLNPIGLKDIKIGINNGQIDFCFKIKLEASKSFDLLDWKNNKLLELQKHIIVMIAAVPVDFTANFEIVSSGNASVSAGFSVEEEKHYLINLTALIVGENDQNLGFTSNFTSSSTSELKPILNANLSAEMEIGPEISFRIYDILGPYFSLPLRMETGLCINDKFNWSSNSSISLAGRFGTKATVKYFKLHFDPLDLSSMGSFSIETKYWTLFDLYYEKVFKKWEFKFPAKLELLSGNLQKGAMGQVLPNPISLRVISSTGFGVPLVPVRFELENGSGSLKDSWLLTDNSGKVSPEWTLGTNATCKLKAFVQDCDNEDIENSPIEITANTNGAFDICTNSGLQILMNKGQTYATGGTTPYTCSRDGVNFSSNFPVFNNSSPGKYSVYAKDKNGCPAMRTFTITASNPCSNSNLNLEILNQANTIQLTGKNGTPPYLYSFDNQNNFNTNRYYSKLTLGSHAVFVKDANGCVFSSSMSILNDNETAAIVALYPASGASYIPVVGLTCGWHAGAYATNQVYDLYLKKGSEDYTKIAENLSATKYSFIDTLTNGTTYTWKISVKDGSGIEKDYGIFTFTTATSNTTTPDVPAMLQPANGSTNASLPILLSWSSQSGDFKYDLFLDETNASQLIANNLSANKYTVTSLTPGKKYFWKVRVKNMVTGEYKESAVWNFTPAQPSDAFITKWDMPAGNFTLLLASYGTYNCKVDWGDGSTSQITGYDDPDRVHNYATSGIYNVAITGIFNTANFSVQSQLIEVVNWGNVEFTYDLSFWGCNNLIKIPDGPITGAIAVKRFDGLFTNCTSLTTIPENLFSNCPDAAAFFFTFGNCTSLTAIPEKLFSNNPKVTEFRICFDGCSGLTSIPAGLFSSNSNVASFDGCFEDCTGIISIPAGLFSGNPNVTSFDGCFSGCTNLTYIPEELFITNSKVKVFSRCFNSCTGLTSIPSRLFSTNPNTTDFSGCFYGCTGIKTIPADLFSLNPNTTDFSACFGGCESLTSIPTGLFSANPYATNFSKCFEYCTGLTSIPVGQFNANPEVTDFSFCFNFCTNLSSIPAGLFSGNPNANNFKACFQLCKGLTSIPAGLFSVNATVTDFSFCFNGCHTLSGNAPELWLRTNPIPQGASCFSNCTGLNNFASIPYSWR